MNKLQDLITTNPRLPGIFFLGLITASLAMAYYVEYVMEIQPCELCLLQRLPYYAVGGFSLFAIIAKPFGVTQKMALFGIGIAFAIGMGLAFYHFGVEEKWWVSSCSTTQSMDLSFEDLKASIMAADFVACDQRSWVIFGLSITVYNTLFSLAYSILSFTILFLMRKIEIELKSK